MDGEPAEGTQAGSGERRARVSRDAQTTTHIGMTWYVLDSYALLASYHRELGGTRVDQLLLDPGNNHWISVINLGEVYYRVAKDNGFQQARQTLTWIGSLPIRMVDADWPLTRAAAQIKG